MSFINNKWEIIGAFGHKEKLRIEALSTALFKSLDKVLRIEKEKVRRD